MHWLRPPVGAADRAATLPPPAPPPPQLLMLSHKRPLDRALAVAREQGKIQVLSLPQAGYAIHEDEPGVLAAGIREFCEHFQIVPRSGPAAGPLGDSGSRGVSPGPWRGGLEGALGGEAGGRGASPGLAWRGGGLDG